MCSGSEKKRRRMIRRSGPFTQSEFRFHNTHACTYIYIYIHVHISMRSPACNHRAVMMRCDATNNECSPNWSSGMESTVRIFRLESNRQHRSEFIIRLCSAQLIRCFFFSYRSIWLYLLQKGINYYRRVYQIDNVWGAPKSQRFPNSITHTHTQIHTHTFTHIYIYSHLTCRTYRTHPDERIIMGL